MVGRDLGDTKGGLDIVAKVMCCGFKGANLSCIEARCGLRAGGNCLPPSCACCAARHEHQKILQGQADPLAGQWIIRGMFPVNRMKGGRNLIHIATERNGTFGPRRSWTSKFKADPGKLRFQFAKRFLSVERAGFDQNSLSLTES